MRDKAGVVQCVVCGPARAAATAAAAPAPALVLPPAPAPAHAPVPAPASVAVADNVDLDDVSVDDEIVSSYESRRREQMMAAPRTAAPAAAAHEPLSKAHACAIRAIETRIETAAAELAVSGGILYFVFFFLSFSCLYYTPLPHSLPPKTHTYSLPLSHTRARTHTHTHTHCYTHTRCGSLQRHSGAAGPAGRR
jgi:hypothetical protein